ncbi:hypothetical protein DFH11DRAFT_1730786 [Phellopilus nigrolimitatus]|nr:hypothetical protein DFH11DRAFT_1730786 [Phellopilus nigrolimitatus]
MPLQYSREKQHARAKYYVELMTKKYYSGKKRTKKNNLSQVQRRAAAERAAVTNKAIYADISAEWARQDEVIRELAFKHNMHFRKMKRKLLRLSTFGKARKVNGWNAWLHCMALKINEDLPPGEKAKLADLQAIACSADTYSDISPEDLQAMKTCHAQWRLLKAKGSRMQNKAIAHDVRCTVNAMEQELIDLSARCESSSLLIVARRSAHSTYSPYYTADDSARNFIELGLGISLHEFCTKFEAYALMGLDGIAKNDNQRRTLLKRHLRMLVKMGLRNITGKPALEMKWKNYEIDIVSEHHVALTGWPSASMNLDSLSTVTLNKIIDAFDSGECKWILLSAEDLAARREQSSGGELSKPPRKTRVDAGVQRGPYKKSSGSARSMESPSEDEEAGAPLSNEYIDDSDDN